jgi:Lipopolysaccharide kinase (Kdo/WaaP) family
MAQAGGGVAGGSSRLRSMSIATATSDLVIGSQDIISAQAQMDEVEIRIKSVGEQCIDLEASIELVTAEVESISSNIDRLTTELNEVTIQPARQDFLTTQLNRLTNKEADLRKEKAKLMDKEADLRKEKADLRKEKAKLMDKEADLRKEKAKLMDEEKANLSLRRMTRSTVNSSVSTLITTASEQSNASSFASTTFAYGFGFFPSSFFFDPTLGLRVWSCLVPTEEDLMAPGHATGLSVLGELGNLLYQGEDSTDGVRSMLDWRLRSPQLTSYKSPINTRGGIATAASKPDFLWIFDGTPLGVLEVKGGSSSVLPALRQAAVTATNIAVNLLERGHSADEIVVPVAGCTGRAMQFGAVIVLEPSFPTFLPTSHILDLACDTSNALASAYLRKASDWVKAFGSTLKSDAGASSVQMALDHSKHHVKTLDKEALRKGLGLFSLSSDSNVSDVGPGLLHMGRVLNRLFAHPQARKVAVFPLSVRSPSPDSGTEDSRCYWLIYEDLAAEGFKIGTPDRILDSGRYQAFLRALEAAITHIHKAGVIHCDLYPSNIMWRADAEGESVEIRLIDWDNAHCLDEQDFNDKCKAALTEHKPTRSATFGVDHDRKYISVFGSAINTGEEKWWNDLASNDKKIIDTAFYALFPV